MHFMKTAEGRLVPRQGLLLANPLGLYMLDLLTRHLGAVTLLHPTTQNHVTTDTGE